MGGDPRAVAGLKRGDIHAARFGRARGSVQAGDQPAVVLQAHGLAHWSTVLVAPLSSSAQRSSFRPPVEVRGNESLVLADQIQPLDAGRLGRRIGTLSADEMIEVEQAVRKVLGLA